MKYLNGSVRLAAICVAVVLLHLPSPALQAQTQTRAPLVRSIVIQYAGPQTVSRERILSQIRTAVGQPYSNAVAEQDIRSLYNTGTLQNVRIFGEPQGDGVKVIIVVQTRAMVNEIEVVGAQRIKPLTIRRQIKLKINEPLAENALETGRQDIIDMYRAKGFNDVDVQFRIQANEARATSRVIYTINEGAKGAVRAIRFEGNSSFSDRRLRKQMKTKAKSVISFLDKSGRLEDTQFQEDLDKIREWYQDHGYIDVQIPDVRKERVGDGLRIVIVIAEGRQYHVGRISIKGEKVATEAKIRALLKMKEGSVYSPKALRDDSKIVTDGYGSGGYVDVSLLPQGTPAGPGLIDVSYTIEEGERYFVERINIVGNQRTKDKVIRREVLIAPGDVYNTVRVDTSKKRLDNLGYFSKVETYPEDTGIVGRKDLTVQVEEKRTGSLNFGAGFSTVDSLIGFVELTQTNFDILNWPTFTGGGQKFRTRLQYGTRRKDIVVGLTEPYFLDQRLSLGGEAFYREATFLSSVYDQRNYGFSIEARKPLTNFLYVSLQYRLEEVDIFNVTATAGSPILLDSGSRVKSEITPSIVYDTRDNVFLTHKGQRVVFTPYVAGGFLGGNVQIYGFDLEASQYLSLPFNTILLFNGELATVDTWGNGDRVPIFDRLFLGGSNNLRGFNFRDISPKDAGGQPLGGQTLARFTVEYTFPIIEKARGAVFYDTGLISGNAYDFSGTVASDVGIGVRLDLPVGPLRIDFGFPIQKAGNSGSPKFNLNAGYQF